MTHYLFRPHVTGPANHVTTPDVIIDRVSLRNGGESSFLPVHRLSTNDALQVFAGPVEVTPAIALVAAGGGVLIGFALLVRQPGEPLAKADVMVARSAWRFRNVVDHLTSLQLSTSAGDSESGISMSQLTPPADFMDRTDGDELALPRGTMVLCAATDATVSCAAPAQAIVQLADPELERSLTHTLGFESVDSDRWAERPLPRYTVGPVGDVEHYI